MWYSILNGKVGDIVYQHLSYNQFIMAVFSIPDQNGNIIQPNRGEVLGNVFMSHGVDFTTEPGRIIPSPTLKNIFDYNDDNDFDNPLSSYEFYNSQWWGVGDVMLKSTTGFPDSAWAQDNISGSPTGDWKEMDGEVFDGNLLVSGVGASQDDIYAFSGSAWSSWWKGTLAQSALDTTYFKPIKVGATGRIYILDDQQKVYNVTTAAAVSTTGNGTLDFSATTYKLICMEPSSSRMWFGGTDTSRGVAIVVEWDMSLNSATANKIHTLQGRAVQAIAVWNDTPIAVLSTGELYIFNGSYFEPIQGARLPHPGFGFTYKGELSGSDTLTVDGGIIHPNGWDIIDGYPHFFFNTKIVNASGTEFPGMWNAPSGIYCYDPQVGLYCRFPIARESGTVDYAAPDVANHGALSATGAGAGKFLTSAKTYSDSAATTIVSLLLHDNERSLAARGWIASVPFQASRHDIWQNIEFLHQKLKNSSDKILIKYRQHRDNTMPIEGAVTWTSTTVFTTTDSDFANIDTNSPGNYEIAVIRGDGSGCTSQISTISEAGGTYTVTLNEPVLAVSASETGRVRVDNWRNLATISSQAVDYHDFTFPETEDSFKLWIKLEFRTAASSQIELDRMIINSKSEK